jgi:GNAT superfamily N-acetyltransferase
MQQNHASIRRLRTPPIPTSGSGQPPFMNESLVAQLGPAHRGLIRAHLLALSYEDRRLRFGHVPSDVSITSYVRAIRFSRDAAFGAFDEPGGLIGFGHLASAADGVEFAISVDSGARRRGIGLALLNRAAVHARNRGRTIL